MTVFRTAHERDLAQAFEVFYENEIRGELNPPPRPAEAPSTLAHILRTGTIYVAEENARILAYAAAITRGGITFLTDLFVRPEQQSSRLGQTLLQYVLPPLEDGVRCTMSSTDPRALALYIRSGMRPQWPHFYLRLAESTPAHRLNMDLEVVEADAHDPELVRWDTQVSGRHRPQDLAYWVDGQRAAPLWFRRDGETVGYGYVRLGAGTLWNPGACTLGPIGTRTAEDATACVLAAVDWARQRTSTLLFISVPGPHPCLSPLLEARFHITYVETYVSSVTTPFFDPCCYIASGSDMF